MELTALQLFLLAPIPITLAVAIYAWHRRTWPGARTLCALMLASALFTLAYWGELFSPTLEAKLAWLKVYYIASAPLTPLMLLLALRYTGSHVRLTAWRLAVFFLPPLLLLAFFLTNDFHHLFYSRFGLDTDGPIPLRTSERGVFYWVNIACVSAYTVPAAILLLQAWRRSARPYNIQAALLFIGVLAPATALLVHMAGYNAFGLVNVMSLSLMITGLAYAWGISQYRVMDLVPVAQQVILNHIGSGVLVVDHRDQVIEINPAACTLLRVERMQAIGERLERVVAPWPALAAQLADGLAATNHEVELFDDNAACWLIVDVQPLPSTIGPHRTTGRVILLLDITAQRIATQTHMEQQRQLAALEEREKLARDLHDGAGQVLGYVSAQVQAAREYLRTQQTAMVDATLVHLAEVTQDAHADLRGYILGAPGEASHMGFTSALEQYVQRFDRQYGLAVELSMSGSEHEAWITAHAQAELNHVVQEALTNIRKHAQVSHAQVHGMISADYCEITVADNGLGFDPATAPNGDTGHFGLGIMHARMAEAGGAVTLVAAPGQGTKVTVTLRRPQVAPMDTDILSHLRVLIADDQPLFSSGLRNLLAARGITVVGVVANGAEAVRAALDLQPDVVLMDIHMPVLDGIEATAQIKQAQPAIKVLILTVAESEETLYAALRAGASGYLLKNLDAAAFFGMLKQLAHGETPLSPGVARCLLAAFAANDAIDESFVLKFTDRQLEILQLMAQGFTYREIGDRLHLSESAVKYNASQILSHLHARTRAEAVRLADRRGLLV